MLKISESSELGGAKLRLAGRVAGEWVCELKTVCETARSKCGALILDFGDVTYVDRAGATLIRGLRRQGISLINCSPFIREQLKQSCPDEGIESGTSE